MSPVSKKTSITLGTLLALSGVGKAAAVAYARIEMHDSRIGHLEKKSVLIKRVCINQLLLVQRLGVRPDASARDCEVSDSDKVE